MKKALKWAAGIIGALFVIGIFFGCDLAKEEERRYRVQYVAVGSFEECSLWWGLADGGKVETLDIGSASTEFTVTVTGDEHFTAFMSAICEVGTSEDFLNLIILVDGDIAIKDNREPVDGVFSADAHAYLTLEDIHCGPSVHEHRPCE